MWVLRWVGRLKGEVRAVWLVRWMGERCVLEERSDQAAAYDSNF